MNIFSVMSYKAFFFFFFFVVVRRKMFLTTKKKNKNIISDRSVVAYVLWGVRQD